MLGGGGGGLASGGSFGSAEEISTIFILFGVLVFLHLTHLVLLAPDITLPDTPFLGQAKMRIC